jgi:hypothetical protein
MSNLKMRIKEKIDVFRVIRCSLACIPRALNCSVDLVKGDEDHGFMPVQIHNS